MALSVVYFGNSQSLFSNRHFQALLETSCDLLAVVDVPSSGRTSTNPAPTASPSFADTARERGVALLGPDSPNLPEFVTTMRRLSADLFIAVGYSQVFRSEILSVPQILPVNFHASLLPAYRGKHPVFWALRNGERQSGLTVHVMDSGLDTGDILYQVQVRTRMQDTVTTLYDRIMNKSVTLVGLLVEDAKTGRLRPIPQPQSGASYYSSVREDDFRIEWTLDAEVLRRWIQTTPGRCFCDLKGVRVFFMDAEVVGCPKRPLPGTLALVGESFCHVAAGRNALKLGSVLLDSGRSVTLPGLCQELGLNLGESLS